MRIQCHSNTNSECVGCEHRFASKPKKGVKFLQEKKLLSGEPEAVAELFHKDERLNRTAMGDYMGEGDE